MTNMTNSSIAMTSRQPPQITYKGSKLSFSKDGDGYVPGPLSGRSYDHIKKGRYPTARSDILAYARDLIGKGAVDVPKGEHRRLHKDLWLIDPENRYGAVAPDWSDIERVIEEGGDYINSGLSRMYGIKDNRVKPPRAHAFALDKVATSSKRLQDVFIMTTWGDNGAYVKFFVTPVKDEQLIAMSFHENRQPKKK